MDKKVAIVGYTSTKDLAPWADESWEIWGINDLYKFIPRADRWFQLHTKEEINRTAAKAPDKRDNYDQQVLALSKVDFPVYMIEKHADIKTSEAYPLDEILKHFEVCFHNKKEVKYFTNSVSYMIAMAIKEDYKEIHVYGVDMAVGSEYNEQRASCEFWLGVAAGRGIKIHVPAKSDLLKAKFLYGFEDEEKEQFKEKLVQTLTDVQAKKINEIRLEEDAKMKKFQYIGAELAVKEIMRLNNLD